MAGVFHQNLADFAFDDCDLDGALQNILLTCENIHDEMVVSLAILPDFNLHFNESCFGQRPAQIAFEKLLEIAAAQKVRPLDYNATHPCHSLRLYVLSPGDN